ncbi:MAG: hypothetical protein FWG07_07955 [Treponema sp.]|nr:hypothetical protein [Treponema sp.]
MLPVYLLSVVLNALTGIILSFCQEEPEAGAVSFSLNNETVRLVIGGLTFITGILKILSPVRGNVPVVGDLFPAIVGLAGGLILLFDFYRSKAPDSIAVERVERIVAIIGRNRKIFGFVCIAAAALHFIFYEIIFL